MRVVVVLGLLAFLGALVARLGAQEGAPDEAAGPQVASEIEGLVEQAGQAEATEIRSEQAKVGERARAILRAVDDFADMRADIEAGIVILSGTARSREAAAQAVATMERLDGVLLVVDDVAIERGLARRLGDSWRQVVERMRALVAGLPLLGAALGILLVFWLLARMVRDADLPYRFASDRALLQVLLRQTVFTALLVAGVVAALNFLDAGAVIGTILGAAGVLGLALGFAFRNIVENYLAGVLLAIRQPFRARDVVSIDGQAGTVLRMTSSETTLMDADGNHLRLPNAMIFNGKVLNYTRNPLRRFTVTVGVGSNVDLERAQELGVRTLQRMKGVIDDPAASGRIAALGDSTVQLELFGWVDQRAAGYVKVASEAHRLVKEAFDRAGTTMPAPGFVVELDAPLPGAPAAPAPAEPRPAPEEIDVSPESDIDAQVAEEIAHADERDLLAEG
jgi:small-conductance mechanosensitive channel